MHLKQPQPFVVAIDGPAAAGKGTIAKLLAAELNFGYLDSGKIYRAIAVDADRAGISPDRLEGLERIAENLHLSDFSRIELTSGKAGRLAALYAGQPAVRRLSVDLQRRIAHEQLGRRGGLVVDGRDIGTVVFPDAPVKLFVTASPEARSARRHTELTGRGEQVSLEEVHRDLIERDHRDANRDLAPLVAAPDAELLDTTEMTIEQAADAARRIVEAARARWERSR